LAFNEAALAQFAQKTHYKMVIARKGHHHTEAIGPPRLLRLRCERPRQGRATNQCDELAPLHGFPRAET
jgi:hypothetical protein